MRAFFYYFTAFKMKEEFLRYIWPPFLGLMEANNAFIEEEREGGESARRKKGASERGRQLDHRR